MSDENKCPMCGAAKSALEDAWVSVYAFAGGCWDTLDGLEDAIGVITNETSIQVNRRLYKEHQQFLRNRNRSEKGRQSIRRQFSAMKEQNDKLFDALGGLVVHPASASSQDTARELYYRLKEAAEKGANRE